MTKKWIAAAAAIAVMWLAVLFTSLFAPVLHVNDNTGNSVQLPLAAIVVAFFAFIATIVIAVTGFRGGPDPR